MGELGVLLAQGVEAGLEIRQARLESRRVEVAGGTDGGMSDTAERGAEEPAMSFNQDWEQEAENWIAWARTPSHDAYWLYRDAFFELLPPPGRATLDVGCGEGRVTRDLSSQRHRVVGVDASPTLLRAAKEADPEGDYVLADAAALPFQDASFDLVVAYNSLMDVQDMPGAVREAARVLEPGHRLRLHYASARGRGPVHCARGRCAVRDRRLLLRSSTPVVLRADV
ncbi:MAG: class I SAM-dependent methyltransferase [Actinomycetota bacterium]